MADHDAATIDRFMEEQRQRLRRRRLMKVEQHRQKTLAQVGNHHREASEDDGYDQAQIDRLRALLHGHLIGRSTFDPERQRAILSHPSRRVAG